MFKQDPDNAQAVNRFLSLNIDKAFELQEIAMLTTDLCDVPAALISLKGDNELYANTLPCFAYDKEKIDNNFHHYAFEHGEPLISIDTLTDHTFKHNTYVNAKGIRFYAGLPLINYEGSYLGSLYVLDTRPRKLSCAHINLLKVLAKRIVHLIEFSIGMKILRSQLAESRNLELKLRSFFESTGSCHLLIGKDMEILAFNKKSYEAIERIYKIKIYSGIKIDQILKGEPLTRFIKNCHNALSGTPIEYEKHVVYKNGESAWWHLTAEPFYGPDNLITGVSINATDITDRKLSEQQITDKNKILQKIAYIQSHELRRPVASILGFMEIFKVNNYQATVEDLQMLQKVTEELDDKIRSIVQFTY